jgi:hypothetical protein
MPRFSVKLKSVPKIIQIEAVTFEAGESTDSSDLFGPANRVAKDADGKELAWFNGKDIVGWWAEPDPPDIQVRLVRPRIQITEPEERS